MEDNQTINPKVNARLKKMLHLANHGSANEGEANNAAEIAQKIMLEHNISMAMVESATSEGSGRKKTKESGNAYYRRQGSRREAPSGVDARAYQAGQATGSTVGLDAQVGAETRKTLK